MKKLSLLGSTGSIGTQTLDVVRCLRREGKFPISVEVLAARSNISRLEEQIREFRPKAVAVFEEKAALELRENIRDMEVQVLSGMEGLCRAAAWETVNLTLNAVVGMVGLRPTLSAIEAGKTLALANKETLVAGGSLVMEAAKRRGVSILPVDSEHSAIFQCLQGAPKETAVKKLILTASGGPFFGRTAEELKDVRPKDALKHPNWSMGAKVTIDSATMMNKGLEIMEASWLFHMPVDNIQVVVHRESVVHSLIEYRDNSVIAQMGVPDMRIPIQYALTYPNRFPSPVEELDLWKQEKLTFYEPDRKAFRCLALCEEAMNRGGLVPAAANGANEEAVGLFLRGKIGFLDIPRLVEEAMVRQEALPANSVEAVLAADGEARRFVRDSVGAW